MKYFKYNFSEFINLINHHSKMVLVFIYPSCLLLKYSKIVIRILKITTRCALCILWSTSECYCYSYCLTDNYVNCMTTVSLRNRITCKLANKICWFSLNLLLWVIFHHDIRNDMTSNLQFTVMHYPATKLMWSMMCCTNLMCYNKNC